MALQTSSNDRRRSGEQRSNPAVVPGLIALVLIAVAILVAVATKKPKIANVPETATKSPFADMPPEVAPPTKEHKAGSTLPPAPEGLAMDPTWIKAKATAAEALELYNATVAAKSKGDTALATSKGQAARKKYNEAVETTAAWEEDLLARYNAYDNKVVAIKDARTDWFNKLRWLEKSVGH